ncbi:MAG: YqgE/AlgH family protein [Acidimicrobiia bacterium]
MRGKLLVAAPPLVDPNFDRTVILLLEHGEEGSLGLILNRPTLTSLADVLPEWNTVADPPAVVFVGGPVSPEAVIALGRGTGDFDGWIPLLDDLGTVDIGGDAALVGTGLAALRVFIGYAGWAAGQLDEELAQHAWFVVDANASDPFAPDPSALWSAVLRRQSGRIAIFATCPEDPSVN